MRVKLTRQMQNTDRCERRFPSSVQRSSLHRDPLSDKIEKNKKKIKQQQQRDHNDRFASQMSRDRYRNGCSNLSQVLAVSPDQNPKLNLPKQSNSISASSYQTIANMIARSLKGRSNFSASLPLAFRSSSAIYVIIIIFDQR